MLQVTHIDANEDTGERQKKIIHVDGGNRIIAERVDPYGHIKVHYASGGRTPEQFQTTFTEFPLALRAIEQHLNTVTKKSVKEPS
jgi:hypothetical protein